MRRTYQRRFGQPAAFTLSASFLEAGAALIFRILTTLDRLDVCPDTCPVHGLRKLAAMLHPDAKEFLVTKIVEQAEREGVSLSEVERKMLYFSEAAPALPNIIELNEAFDRDYDRAEYESRIVKLIRRIRSMERRDKDATRAWNKAVQDLSGEDHYLLVMIGEAGGRQRPPGDLIKLVGTAIFIVVVVLVVALFLSSR